MRRELEVQPCSLRLGRASPVTKKHWVQETRGNTDGATGLEEGELLKSLSQRLAASEVMGVRVKRCGQLGSNTSESV